MKIRIGTRASKLAIIQAETIKNLLDNRGYTTEIIKITTSGDRVLDRPIDRIGGYGVFSREIEKQLLSKEIDLAVHSLKDLPSILHHGLELAKAVKAHDPRDVFVGKKPVNSIEELNNKIIASSSVRRKALMKEHLKGITFTNIRGNIDSRLRKVREEKIDGSIFAKAGLDRLGVDQDYFILDPEIFIPAPCQGILGVEFREEDSYLRDIFEEEYDEFSNFRMEVERAFQKELSATCSSPVGIYTKLNGDKVELFGCFKKDDDDYLHLDKISGSKREAVFLAKNLAKKLRSKNE
ncbi:MAG: hydroxymethylbilane synthase [Lagierella massiliensis]|nr:hydroxymethylbilane synthase [Lagierella massiliensis]